VKSTRRLGGEVGGSWQWSERKINWEVGWREGKKIG
jgi:hypothetical protein